LCYLKAFIYLLIMSKRSRRARIIHQDEVLLEQIEAELWSSVAWLDCRHAATVKPQNQVGSVLHIRTSGGYGRLNEVLTPDRGSMLGRQNPPRQLST